VCELSCTWKASDISLVVYKEKKVHQENVIVAVSSIHRVEKKTVRLEKKVREKSPSTILKAGYSEKKKKKKGR